jgi:hypothetical protein
LAIRGFFWSENQLLHNLFQIAGRRANSSDRIFRPLQTSCSEQTSMFFPIIWILDDCLRHRCEVYVPLAVGDLLSNLVA